MRKTIIASTFALACLGAQAASDFYVVVPVKGRIASATVQLSSSSLPGGMVGGAYTYDFKQNLQVTGDPAFNGAGVTWSVAAGSLPVGLALDGSTGVLSGTASAAATYLFSVQASYKAKVGAQAYQVAIAAPTTIALQAGGYRTWANGQLATSCAGYAAPAAGFAYQGDTGDGVYRIQPAGQPATDAYCDMTSDGGGWTLIVHGGAPGALTGATWNVATSVNDASLANAADNAPASKYSDAFIAALPRAAGYRFSIYGGTGSGTARYANASCLYQHASSIVAGTACNYSYSTLPQAQAGTSAGRYGGGGKTWHFGFSDDANTGLNSLYLITNHRMGGSDNALWYTGNGNVSSVTNSAQGARYRLWVK